MVIKGSHVMLAVDGTTHGFMLQCIVSYILGKKTHWHCWKYIGSAGKWSHPLSGVLHSDVEQPRRGHPQLPVVTVQQTAAWAARVSHQIPQLPGPGKLADVHYNISLRFNRFDNMWMQSCTDVDTAKMHNTFLGLLPIIGDNNHNINSKSSESFQIVNQQCKR